MLKIDARQLHGMIEQRDDFLLVNTLPTDSFDATQIEGAVNIPQERDDFVDQVTKRMNDKKKPVVVYCANEACDSSVRAAEKLEDAGFEQVLEFTAGAKGWEELHAESAAS